MLPNVLLILSFFQDRGLIEDGAFGPQAEVAASQAEVMEFRNLIFTALYGLSLGTSVAKVKVIYQKLN